MMKMQTASDLPPSPKKTYSTRYGKFEIQNILTRYGYQTFLSASHPVSVIGLKDGVGFLFCVCSHGKFIPDLVAAIRQHADLHPFRIIICVRENSGYQYRELLLGGLVPWQVDPDGCS